MNQIQQKINFLRFLDKIVDILIISLSILLSIISENIFHDNPLLYYSKLSFNYKAFPFVVFTTILSILYIERFFIYRVNNYLKIIQNVIIISISTLVILIFMDFVLKSQLFYRTTILFYGCYVFIFLLLKRFFYKAFLSTIRANGKDVKNILIVGLNSNTKTFIDKINNHIEFGFKIINIIYENNTNENEINLPIVSFKNIDEVLLTKSIDEVFIIEIKDKKLSNNFIEKIENMGINYHIVIDSGKFKFSDNSSIVPKLDYHYEIPTISFYSVKATYYKLVIKNFVERIFASILFIATLPILLLSMLLISFTSRGYPIFVQERVGLRNRRFNQYKLRTMISKAEELKDSLLHLNEQDGAIFKMTNDPRITFVGKILRKFSIDELPQLINVIKGDMNLIGPRPPIPSEVKQYNINHYRRFSFKPGITGLWQVSGRNKIKSFEDWVKLDLEYIDNWCLLNDLKIALKTIPTVLKGTGK